jgi:hypothetical protein
LEEVWTHLQLLINRCEKRHGIFPMLLVSMLGGCSERQLDDSLVRGCVWSKDKSGEWSEREELGLGKSLDPLAVAHKHT